MIRKNPARITAYLNMYRKNYQMYLFLLIPLLYIVIFSYIPMFGVQIAFRDFTPASGIFGGEFVGFKHFMKFFTSYQAKRVISNTLILSFYSIIAGFPIPVILALAINCLPIEKLKKVYQNILYMPHFISTIVLIGIIMQLVNPVVGIYGIITKALTGSMPADIMANPRVFSHLYVWSDVWQHMGWSSVIYVAALSNVDAEQHEAAMLDGASRFKRVLYVDFPAIIPTAVILLILRCGGIMSIGFEKVYLLQNNLNLRTSEVISTYVYKVGLAAGGGANFSYATAIGLFNSFVGLVLISVVNIISRRMGDISLW